MLRLLKDPLIHFLLLGGLLFILYDWRGEPEGPDPHQIEISDEEVQGIWQALAILHGHVPTRDEMWSVLEPNIKEEILYREAIALGLDRDDSQVRLRLTEKMLFLTQDVAEPIAPTDAELVTFFAVDPGRFRQPATWTFEQIFFSPSQHGAQVEAVAAAALAELRTGETASVVGDGLLFDNRYERLELAEIERLFGETFATTVVVMLPDDEWQGPVRSDFGIHLVRVTELIESVQPDLEDIRPEVLSTLVAQRRLEANEAEYRKLRDRYEILVDLPEFPEETEEPAGSVE
jgi:hypothetical protein